MESIAVASPPQKEFDGLPHPAILAACALLSITEVHAVGGATGAVLTGVFALTRTIDQSAALLAIGYSFDSIADALFPRFESRMVQLAGALPGPAKV